MNKSTVQTPKKRGRPALSVKLSNAEKQKAYRQRCAAQAREQQNLADFRKTFEYEINLEISKVTKQYQAATGLNDQVLYYGQMKALKNLKETMHKKFIDILQSNLTDILDL